MEENDFYKFGMKKLKGESSKFVLIPYELITDTSIHKFRSLVYCYVYLKSGMDNTLLFNTENFKQYAYKKTGVPNPTDTYADRVIEVLNSIKDKWFLFYDGDIKKKQYKSMVFDKDKMYEYCSDNRFAVVYLDELNTILSYKSNDTHDNRFDNSMILLVFMYIRANIPIRHNKYSSNVEAYNAYYKSIGEELGLSERMVSKCVDVLVRLGLLYVKERSSIKYYDKKSKSYKFRTPTIVFCNTYRRIKKGIDVYLDNTGENYYLPEIENKIKYLEKHNIW